MTWPKVTLPVLTAGSGLYTHQRLRSWLPRGGQQKGCVWRLSKWPISETRQRHQCQEEKDWPGRLKQGEVTKELGRGRRIKLGIYVWPWMSCKWLVVPQSSLQHCSDLNLLTKTYQPALPKSKRMSGLLVIGYFPFLSAVVLGSWAWAFWCAAAAPKSEKQSQVTLGFWKQLYGVIISLSSSHLAAFPCTPYVAILTQSSLHLATLS